MKFLFKTTLLILVCMSNFIFSMETDTLLEKINGREQQKKEIEQSQKIIEYISEIIMSDDCNCVKLNLLTSSDFKRLQIISLAMGYNTPKSEKELQKEKEELAQLFQNSDEEIKELIDKRIENMDKLNEQMKCLQKILKAINELKNQNKSE